MRFLACLVVMMFIVWTPGSAAAFGTVDTGGQRREHERVTRAALSCAGDAGSYPHCFAPASIDYLAGHDREFGAVGAPDSDELSDPAAHCDNADFLEGRYPRTRDQATASLVACVNHMRTRFAEGVEAARGLLDDQGEVIPGEVNLQPPCRSRSAEEDRAKCLAIEGLGRALHGTQDFYAHSNWADAADPGRPAGPDNPPGLDLPAPSTVLDLRGSGVRAVPRELTTGCFVLADQVDGTGVCERRVTHAALNKDNGLESAPTVALIDEERCIGCTKCLPPCPVDAIVGAPRAMHTVVAELCTGCELCIAPCPVDCIVMIPLLASPAHAALVLPPADASRARFEAHNERTARRAAERAAILADKKRGARPAR